MTTKATLTALIAILLGGAALGAQPNDAERKLAAENILQADVDADGALSKSEFRTLIDLNAEDGIGRAAMIKRFGRYSMAFDRVDANADGLVTPDEIKQMAEQASR